MRKGENPFKIKTSVEPPAAITVGVLSSIPEQEGYFRGAFDSLKLCLASIRYYADRPFELLIVDNGSCREVRAYLQDELAAGHIDYLVLNKRNIGRPNGVRQILRAAPGDMVFYSDGDMYFRPGWMKAHLDILEAYPNVGVVGGQPAKLASYHTTSTLCWVEAHSKQALIEKGSLIPDEWLIELARSLGYDPGTRLRGWQSQEDCRVTYKGIVAYVGANHPQFLMPRRAIEKLPHQRFAQATGINELIMDQVLDEAGFLRFSTVQPVVYHMGNSVDEEWLISEFNQLVGHEPMLPFRGSSSAQRMDWFWTRSKVRRVLRFVHNWSLERYYR